MKNKFPSYTNFFVIILTFLFLISTSIIDFNSTCFAQSPWTKKADMPTGRWDPSTCVVDGKIYVIGGAGPVYQALRTVEVYYPAKDTWVTKTDMPTARQGLSASVVNGKIYAIGGSVSSSASYSSVEILSSIEEYDPKSDTWAKKKDLPVPRSFHSACVIDNRIYIIGGSSSFPFSASLTLIMYDPAEDTWTKIAEIPEGIYSGCFAGVVDGKIYVVGGDGRGKRVDEFNPATNIWTRKTDMLTLTTDQATCALNGKIYVFGGENGPPPKYPGMTKVNIYDPAKDSWKTAPELPTGRFGLRASAADGKIYVIGGMDYWGSTNLRTVEEFDP